MAPRLVLPSILAAFALIAAKGAIAQDALKLTFDWPDALKAKVVLNVTVVTARDDERHTAGFVVSYRLGAAPAADGISITTQRLFYRTQNCDGDGSPESFRWDSCLRKLMPTGHEVFIGQYLVSKRGLFVGYDYIGEACAYAGIAMHPWDTPKTPEECRREIEDDHLQRNKIRSFTLDQASRDWGRIVGWWAGEKMLEGKSYEAEAALWLGYPSEERIPATRTSRFVGRSPCSQGTAEAACAKIEMVEVLSTGSDARPMWSVAASFFPDLMFSLSDSTMGTLQRRTELQLLTDPSTLLPQRVEELETIKVTLNDSPATISATVHSIWTYEYESLR